MRVSSAEFIRNYGTMTDQALSEAVTITRNGKDRLVVLSAAEYQKLLARFRRVVLPNELSEMDIEAIAATEVPDSYAQLDAEISNQ
ncbi:MAG: type II toxin-antitoxin system Phd/YefM family antitoxin [Acetobacter malorum]|uniref:type II toxin-antitoxin system Phd/YefM family antitoxin n=1 Tax=Acetobacter malorum TaxID=178901 RepID=UPI0039E98048